MAGRFGVLADTADTPVRGEIRFRPGALIVCDPEGRIEMVVQPGDGQYYIQRQALEASGDLFAAGRGVVLLPGFVDLHNHAPQWPQLGKALDVPLEVWLDRYTFPLEARFADPAFAERVYRSLVDRTLRNGTTTAVYFGTVHQRATRLLVDICLEYGQRAVVGKVAMDLEETCPDYYRDESAAAAISATADFIEYVRAHTQNENELVLAAATPRFIPSCSDKLLTGMGELVAATSCLVQTHCSESDWAHHYGLDRYGRSDVLSYDAFGLLRRGTVLAHSNFIDAADMDLVAARGAAVAHCPLSNAFFANAVFPVRQALERGVTVGLGTDVSGGPHPSLMRTAADTVVVSRMLEDGVDSHLPADVRGVAGSRVSFAEALWMATSGGGQALGLPIGLIEPGYRFDAVAVDTSRTDTDLIVWPDLDTPADIVQKILNNAAPVDIATVWVDGRIVVDG